MSGEHQINILYAETSVWLARMFQESDRFEPSKKIFDDVYNGKSLMLISPLLLMEVIDALRRHIPIKLQDISSAEDADRITKEKIGVFLKDVHDLINSGNAILLKNKNAVYDFDSKVLTKLQQRTGSVVAYGKNNFRYKGAGFVDIGHAYYACHAYGTIFYTWDAGFATLINDPDFKTVEFRILKIGQLS